MRGTSLCLALIVIALPSLAQTDMRVYGQEFGKQFTVPECKLMQLGKKKSKNRTYVYKAVPDELCYQWDAGLYGIRSGPVPVKDGEVKLDAPYGKILGVENYATVISGNLEAIKIITSGVNDQSLILDALEKKYGAPTSVTNGTAQNLMGAVFQTILDIWQLKSPELTVTYRNINGSSLDEGRVTIETPLAIKNHPASEAQPSL